MNWKTSIGFVLASLLFSCEGKHQSQTNQHEETPLSYLIEVYDLEKLREVENIKLIDFRKADEYAEGHIEKAIHVWRSDIEDQSYPYGGMMAPKDQIEELFSRLGIENDDQLIIYDDNGLCDAARLWWLLQNYDFTKVRLLHGGLSAWINSGGTLTDKTPEFNRSTFTLQDDTSMKYHLSKDELVQKLAQDIVLIDTRSRVEFQGKMQKNGAALPGRIPGSLHMDWMETIDVKNMKFKSNEQLIKLADRKGLNQKDEVVVYCHSGVRSAHTTFVLTQLLGFENVKNYDGSWTEWSHLYENNIERDSILITN